MTTEQIKAGLEEERSAWRQRSTYGSPDVKAAAAYKADVMDAALSRLGEPSEDVQPVIKGLEALRRETWRREQAELDLLDRALTLLRQQADADLATRDWREFVGRWKAEATSNEVRLLQARVKDLVAQLEALEQRLGVEQRRERPPVLRCPQCESARQERIAGWWLCNACGHEWNDPSPAVPAPPGKE